MTINKIVLFPLLVLAGLIINSVWYNYDAYQKSKQTYYYTVVDKVQYKGSKGRTISDLYIKWEDGSTDTWSVHPLTYKWKEIGGVYKRTPKYMPIIGLSSTHYLPDRLVGINWFINIIFVACLSIVFIIISISSIIEVCKKKS